MTIYCRRRRRVLAVMSSWLTDNYAFKLVALPGLWTMYLRSGSQPNLLSCCSQIGSLQYVWATRIFFAVVGSCGSWDFHNRVEFLRNLHQKLRMFSRGVINYDTLKDLYESASTKVCRKFVHKSGGLLAKIWLERQIYLHLPQSGLFEHLHKLIYIQEVKSKW